MPTPSAVTGKVATFRPMPSHTIKASASTEVSARGMMAQATARQERKVKYASATTAAYTSSSISWLAFSTTAFVAASKPALPAASRNCASALSLSLAKAATSALTRRRVAALWSLRYTCNCSREKPASTRLRGARELAVFSAAWFGCSSYQRGLPSFMPTAVWRASEASDCVVSTPST